MIIMSFGLQKFSHLAQNKNPIINQNEFPLEAGTKYATDEEEFMVAFSAESYDTGVILSDPRNVRWVTAFWEKKNDEWFITWYPMHPCSEEELERFESPDNEVVASKVQRL